MNTAARVGAIAGGAALLVGAGAAGHVIAPSTDTNTVTHTVNHTRTIIRTHTKIITVTPPPAPTPTPQTTQGVPPGEFAWPGGGYCNIPFNAQYYAQNGVPGVCQPPGSKLPPGPPGGPPGGPPPPPPPYGN